jgi:hypothetical protein
VEVGEEADPAQVWFQTRPTEQRFRARFDFIPGHSNSSGLGLVPGHSGGNEQGLSLVSSPFCMWIFLCILYYRIAVKVNSDALGALNNYNLCHIRNEACYYGWEVPCRTFWYLLGRVFLVVDLIVKLEN